MTGTELRHALIDLKLRQKALAMYFNVTEAAVSNWCRESRPVPEAVALYIEGLIKQEAAQ